MKRFFLILFIAFGLTCGSETLYAKRVDVLVDCEPSEVFKYPGATYVIRHTLDLKGRTLVIPPNSHIRFYKGKICNGTVTMNNVTITASNEAVFSNVVFSDEGNTNFKASWFWGGKMQLKQTDFEMLPHGVIDFEGREYVSSDILLLYNAKWKNLKLKTKGITLSAPKVYECPVFSITGGTMISSVNKIPESLVDKIVSISTSQKVAYDWRPDSNGIPTLYKGVTSIVESCYGKTLAIKDEIEAFSSSTTYNGHRVVSTAVFFDPIEVSLKNCYITLMPIDGNLCGNIYIIGASNIDIDSCTFDTFNGIGSKSLLGLNDCVGGTIKNTIVKESLYPHTVTSYGIQLFGSTRIVVDSCEFSGHRRSVDFSGFHESRYNIVRNCHILGNGGEDGSALGGHSTSYSNIIENNRIEGNHTRGIYVRGENETIIGNTIKGSFSAAYIVAAYKTKVIRNHCEPLNEEYTNTFLWQERVDREDNSLVIVDNDASFRIYFVRGITENEGICVENNTLSCQEHDTKRRIIYVDNKYKGIYKNNKLSHNKYVTNHE